MFVEGIMIDTELVDELAEMLSLIEVGNGLSNIVLPGILDENLRYFLENYNGGYTKDCYVHFFGRLGPPGHNIFEWNSSEWWKQYFGLGNNWFFFAEDVFGNQFGVNLTQPELGFFMLWVDDGRLEPFAPDFENFVEFTIFDYAIFGRMRGLSENFYQVMGGRVPRFHHIAYKKPILLGGDASDVDNLETAEALGHIRLLGQIVHQVKQFPIGTKIKEIAFNKVKNEVTLIA
jgi:hypothetical protein